MSICQQSVNSARYYLFIIVFIAHVYNDITYRGYLQIGVSYFGYGTFFSEDRSI